MHFICWDVLYELSHFQGLCSGSGSSLGVVRTGIDLLGSIFPFATGFAGGGSKSFAKAWEFM